MIAERLEGISPAEMPEVLRVASELYAQDRAAIEQAEQQREILRAADEAGLPHEYLERAAATLQAQRAAASLRTQQAAQSRPHRGRRLGPLVLLGVGALLFSRLVSRPPEPPPPPMMTMPATAPALTFGPSAPVDLSDFTTHRLDESMLSTAGNDLSNLATGLPPGERVERTLNGIRFSLDGIIVVGPGESSNGPGVSVPMKPEVTGIPIRHHVKRLHFLHGTHWQTRHGATIGNYVLHYADGAQIVLPIRYGIDVVNWWSVDGNSSEAARYHVAWRGRNDASASHREGIRLFTKSWENPRPDVAIRSMDMVTGDQAPGRSAPAPFLVGLTVEEAGPGTTPVLQTPKPPVAPLPPPPAMPAPEPPPSPAD